MVSKQDASEFYEWASTHEKIKLVFYTHKDLDAADTLIKERNAALIPGSTKLHAVVPADSHSVYTRDVSGYCQPCLSGDSPCDSLVKHQLITGMKAL
ncbi:hypothetical protein DPMN_101571 [Dreissena polymorpha]|uniref:Uncharacterized protein n=1 Tax=Dreissena polymorpha TaxID=45954 RepID=A0A9D4LLD7_DREPO|nr:hypothetical protein DPMN_101571 [Dreissena polymorpha]